MKKLFLFIVFTTLIFSQNEPLHTGELTIELNNQGSTWNVTFTLTAIGTRWDDHNNITEDYESVSVNINSDLPVIQSVAYFDHIWDILAGEHPIFAAGLYKISAFENGVEKAYFFMDWRTSTEGWNWSLDVTFKYDYTNKHFKNAANSQIIDYSYQTLWDLTTNYLETINLEDYWSNSLALINNGSNNPKLVWGPYPSESFDVTNYEIWRGLSPDGTNPPSTYSLLGNVGYSVFQYTDNQLTIGGSSKYFYKVRAKNDNLEYSEYTNLVSIGATSSNKMFFVKYSENALTQKIILHQNYPNPFNPTTTITFSISESEHVILKVFDILGNEIITLVNEQKEPGIHVIRFDASKIPSGVYLYEITAGKQIEKRKLILQK